LEETVKYWEVLVSFKEERETRVPDGEWFDWNWICVTLSFVLPRFFIYPFAINYILFIDNLIYKCLCISNLYNKISNKVKLFSNRSYGCVIRRFHKLFWRACRNKLKTSYGCVISCFRMFSKIVSQVLNSVDKLKFVNTNRS
jgi:hypothetical protein